MSWFNRLSIRWVILLTPILTFVVLLAMTGVFVNTQKAALLELDEFQAFELKKAAFFDGFSNSLATHHALVIEHYRLSSSLDKTELDEAGFRDKSKALLLAIQNFEKKLNVFIQVSHYNTDTAGDTDINNKLASLLKQFSAYRQKFSSANLVIGMDKSAMNPLLADANQYYMILNESLIEASNIFQGRLSKAIKASHKQFTAAVDFGVTVLVSVIAFLIVLSLFLSSSFSRSLKSRIELLHELATHEDLAQLKNKNELGVLSEVIKRVKVTFDDLDKTREALRWQEKNLRNTLNHMVEAVIATNDQGEMRSFNAAAETLFGYSETEVIGKNICMLMPTSETWKQDDYLHPFHRSGDVQNSSSRRELRGLKKNNKEFPMHWASGVFSDGNDGDSGYIFTCTDITEMKRQQLETDDLRYQTMHDSLTKLANRVKYKSQLNKFFEKAKENNLKGAILFIDLDRFKPVNDTAGHEAGDVLLRKISGILSKYVRKNDTLARIGGDEFCVLLEECPVVTAEKIANAMRRDVDEFVFNFNDMSFNISLSIGVSEINQDTESAREAFNSADNACQISKNEGRNRVHVSSLDRGEFNEYVERIAWLPKINKALTADEFILYAQNIIGLDGYEGKRHCEILIRLKNEDGTIVSPGVFIPPAERYDLMPKIDYWVLKHAFSSLKHGFTYSINLSGQTVSDENLASFIDALQETYQVEPQRIIFEITETAAMQNIDKTVAFIIRMRKIGYRFSLDDFGSGLSSFGYLKKLPVDYLKIDGSLVKDIAIDQTSYAMVKSINEVAHSMGIKTIAEFVENEKILLKLKAIGVDNAQGYYIHKPQPLETIGEIAEIVPLSIVASANQIK